MFIVRRNQNMMRWVARLHFWIMFFSFVLYLGLGFSLGPEFLYQDIRKKFFAHADDTITVTGVVPGPPLVPSVTATPICVSGVPRVLIDWPDDSGSTSFAVDRDALPLTTGLVVSQYTDTSVAANTSYSYQVTALGPMFPGTAVSALVAATTLDCTNTTPVTVTIETLGGKYVAVIRHNINLSKSRPKVTGTSNTPYAIIDIALTNPTISARITANVNGYFEWIPPIKIDTGSHLLTVTATDPNDNSRISTDSFVFWTKQASGATERDRKQRVDISASESDLSDFDFFVRVRNVGRELYQEERLSADIVSRDGTLFPAGAVGQVFLNDPSHQDVIRLSGEQAYGGKNSMTIEKLLPLSLEPGTYRVRADILFDDALMSREESFLLKGLPLLVIGGREVTYFEAASYIGTFFFLLLFLFLFFLLFFVREYWLYVHRLRNITERQLARFGFLGSTRKGVVR